MEKSDRSNASGGGGDEGYYDPEETETEIPSTSTASDGGGLARNQSLNSNASSSMPQPPALKSLESGSTHSNATSNNTAAINAAAAAMPARPDNAKESNNSKDSKTRNRRKRFSFLVTSKASRPPPAEPDQPMILTTNPKELLNRSRHIRQSMGFVFDESPPADTAPKHPRGFEAVETKEQEPRFQLGDPKHDPFTFWGKFRNTAGAWINNRWIQYGVTTLIVLNAIVLGSMTYLFDNPQATSVLEKVDLTMLCMFTFEIAVQLLYLGFGDFFKNGWMLFDGGIILFSWIFIDSQLSIFRSFRIFRLFALVSRWTSLRRLFKAVGRTMPKMATIGAALMLFFYTFCVLYTSLYHHLFDEGYLDYDYFGRLDFTFLTLFQFMTLDSWTFVVRQVMEKYPFSWLGFVAWVVVTAFFVLNLVVAVICESLIELHNSADNNHQSKLLSHQKGMMETQTQELVNETRQVLTLQREMLANQVAMATTLVEIMKHLKANPGSPQHTVSGGGGAGRSSSGGSSQQPRGPRPTQYDFGRKDSLAKLISDMGPLSSDDDDDGKDNNYNQSVPTSPKPQQPQQRTGPRRSPKGTAAIRMKTAALRNSRNKVNKTNDSTTTKRSNAKKPLLDDDEKSLDDFDFGAGGDSSEEFSDEKLPVSKQTGKGRGRSRSPKSRPSSANNNNSTTNALDVKRMLEASLADFGNWNLTDSVHTPASTANNSMTIVDEEGEENASGAFAITNSTNNNQVVDPTIFRPPIASKPPSSFEKEHPQIKSYAIPETTTKLNDVATTIVAGEPTCSTATPSTTTSSTASSNVTRGKYSDDSDPRTLALQQQGSSRASGVNWTGEVTDL